MKQKTAALQRWLDRLSAACENRKWKSAVAEADCLSAELRQVREELWEKAESEIVPVPVTAKLRNRVSFGARSLAIAVVIICLSTLPIDVESGNTHMVAALPTGSESRFDEIALVSSEEKELLQLLRTSLNESNIAVNAAQKPSRKKPAKAAAEKAAKIKTKTAAEAVPVPAAKTTETVPAVRQTAENNIEAEDLLTLIQIGEQSLRGGDPAIKFVN